MHTELILIDCNLFHNIIGHSQKLIDRVNNLIALNSEFWDVELDRETAIAIQAEADHQSFGASSSILQSTTSKSRTVMRYFHKRINHNGTFYKVWRQLMGFHVAAISSILFAYFISMGPPSLKLAFTVIKYTLDILYLPNFYIGARLTYADTDSGLTVTDSKLIALKYFKSIFWLDLFTICPFDLVAICMGSRYIWQRYLSINRVCRIAYMILYYENNKFKLKGISLVRWMYLVYNTAFVIQMLTSVW